MIFYEREAGMFSGAVALGGCYAGMDIGKNNVAMQSVHDVGPLPAGVYTIGPLMIHPPGDPLRHLGPCMMLTPDPANEMFGRSGFFIHLDNPAHPGFSSNGCIVCQNDAAMTGLAKLQQLNALVAAGENRVTVQ